MGGDLLEDIELISDILSDHRIYMELSGFWLGRMITCRTYMMPVVSLHLEYSCHSRHHRLNPSLLWMSFGCFTWETQ